MKDSGFYWRYMLQENHRSIEVSDHTWELDRYTRCLNNLRLNITRKIASSHDTYSFWVPSVYFHLVGKSEFWHLKLTIQIYCSHSTYINILISPYLSLPIRLSHHLSFTYFTLSPLFQHIPPSAFLSPLSISLDISSWSFINVEELILLFTNKT